MGRRVASPQQGCGTAEEVPRASSAMLGQAQAPTRAVLGSLGPFWGDPPSSWRCSQRRGTMAPHGTQQTVLRGLHCPDGLNVLTSLPSMHSPPARAHLQVLVWLPVLSGEAGGEGQQAGASSWLCESRQFQCRKDVLQGEDEVQSVLRVSIHAWGASPGTANTPKQQL